MLVGSSIPQDIYLLTHADRISLDAPVRSDDMDEYCIRLYGVFPPFLYVGAALDMSAYCPNDLKSKLATSSTSEG